jgi:TP901 family phage tail tape measure protein
MAEQIASLYAKVSADSSALEKSLKGIKGDLTDTQKGFGAFEKAASLSFKAVGLAAAAAFAAVGAGMVSSIKAATAFEQNVADIGAVMSLTAGETENLQQHIMDLGLDPNLKVSATEASDAIMSLGTAGLSVSQIMGGASEATVLLANATGGDMASAAGLMTDVMGQYGIKAEDTARIVDQLTGLTVASKFSFEDAALAFGQVGGVAGSVGLTLEDTNAILGVTAYNFNSGSDAATSMKTFLQRLVPTTNDAKEAMMQLGLSTGDDVVPAFFHANGMMKSAEEIAANLQTAFAGLSDSQRIEAASTIFGTDAMRTALALVEGGTPSITKFKDEVAKVDAGEMASKRMNTFAGAIEIVQGIMETLSISIGQKFLPVLRPLVEQFGVMAQTQGPKLIDFFGKFADKVGQLIQQSVDWGQRVLPPLWEKLTQIGTAINTVTGLVMQAFGPLTKIEDQWIKWHDIVAALGVLLVAAMIPAIAGFLAAMAPVVLLVAKVTVAIAVLRNAWETNFLGIRDITEDVLDRISGWLQTYTTLWKGSWGRTLKYFTENSREAWQELYDTIVGKFRDWTRETKHVVSTWSKEVIDKFEYWYSTVYFGIRSWAVEMGWVVRDWWNDMKEKFSFFFEFWDSRIQPWVDRGRQMIQGWWDGIREKWNSFTEWFRGRWEDLVKNFKSFFGIHSPSTLFRSYGSDMMEGLQQGIDAGSGMVFDSIDAMNDGIAGKLAAIPGLIDRSQAVVAMEAFTAKMKMLMEQSKSIGPYWLQPDYVPPASTMPPVLKDPNGPISGPFIKIPKTPTFNAANPDWRMGKEMGDIADRGALATLRSYAAKAGEFIKSLGQLQGSSTVHAALQRIAGNNLEGTTLGTITSDVQAIMAEVKRRDAFDSTADPQMERNNELLEILINTLRQKNLSVSLAGLSREEYGSLVTHTSGLRR